MKIIQLTNVVAPDQLGGLQRYVREFCAELVAQGNEVVVIGKRTNGEHMKVEEGHDGVRILRHSSPSKSDKLFALKYPFVVVADILKLLREETSRAAVVGGEHVVHAHHPVPALALLLARIPYVYTFHAPVYKEIAGERQGSYRLPPMAERMAVWAMRFVEGQALKRALRVITLSQFVASEAISLGLSSERISVVPGGVDLSFFKYTAMGSLNAPDERLQLDSFRLFTARRLVERTGVEELVLSMVGVRKSIPAVQLRIAGTGPREAAIQGLIRRNGLADCVTLLGRIPDVDLLTEYQLADLTVTPTQYLEGFGLSTAESLAAGTPALVTPIGANAELVSDFSPYFVTHGPEPKDLERSIIKLFGERTIRSETSEILRSGYAEKWGWPSVVIRILALYETNQPSVRSTMAV